MCNAFLQYHWSWLFRAFVLLWLLCGGSVSSASAQIVWFDLDASQVSIVSSDVELDRRGKVLYKTYELTNTSDAIISGPVRMVIASSPTPVVSADGYTDDGFPYIDIVSSPTFQWDSGYTISNYRVDFQKVRVIPTPFMTVEYAQNEDPDADEDGVSNSIDLCPNTASGDMVDEDGCAWAQYDDDGDGVNNGDDLCTDTPQEDTVDPFDGCTENWEFYPDATVTLETVTTWSPSGIYSYSASFSIQNMPGTDWLFGKFRIVVESSTSPPYPDGYTDAGLPYARIGTTRLTLAPGASMAATIIFHYMGEDPPPADFSVTAHLEVDTTPISPTPEDSDGDMVLDFRDSCPGTAPGAVVARSGCSLEDADSDAVCNELDFCPGTPAEDAADKYGCGASQKDTDDDTLTDNVDACPTSVDLVDLDMETGCSPADLDDYDLDGVVDHKDACLDTPSGEAVDVHGCTLLRTVAAPILFPAGAQLWSPNDSVRLATKVRFANEGTIISVTGEEVDAEGGFLGEVGAMLDDGIYPDAIAADDLYVLHFAPSHALEETYYYRVRVTFADGHELISASTPYIVTRFPFQANPINDVVVDIFDETTITFYRNTLELSFVDDASQEEIEDIVAERFGVIVSADPGHNSYIVDHEFLIHGDTINGLLSRADWYLEDLRVLSADPLYVATITASATDPSLLYPTELPSLDYPGNTHHLQDVQALAAAVLERGESCPVQVAVVDLGIDFDHPDLVGALAETKVRVFDSDIGAYVLKDVKNVGWNFQGRAMDRGATASGDHGTAVAGGMAARSNNNEGTLGVASGLSTRIHSYDTSTETSDFSLPLNVSKAIRMGLATGQKLFAIAQRTMALGKTRLSTTQEDFRHMYDIIWQLPAYGALAVSAVGNDALLELSFPCVAGHEAADDNYLCVGAADVAGNRWLDGSGVQGSQWGAWVDIAASARTHTGLARVADPDNPHGIGSFGFTSSATAQVAGAAALVWSKFPHYTAEQVRQRLLDTAVPLDPAHQIGNMLNVLRAVSDFEAFVTTRTNLENSMSYGFGPLGFVDELKNPGGSGVVFPVTATLYAANTATGLFAASQPKALHSEEGTIRGLSEWVHTFDHSAGIFATTLHVLFEDAVGKRTMARLPAEMEIVPLTAGTSIRSGFRAQPKLHGADLSDPNVAELHPTPLKLQIWGIDKFGVQTSLGVQTGDAADQWTQALPLYPKYLVRYWAKSSPDYNMYAGAYVFEQEIVYFEETFAGGNILNATDVRSLWGTPSSNTLSLLDTTIAEPIEQLVDIHSLLASDLVHTVVRHSDADGLCNMIQHEEWMEDSTAAAFQPDYAYDATGALVPGGSWSGPSVAVVFPDAPYKLHSTPQILRPGWTSTEGLSEPSLYAFGLATDTSGTERRVSSFLHQFPITNEELNVHMFILDRSMVAPLCDGTPLSTFTAQWSLGSIILQELD